MASEPMTVTRERPILFTGPMVRAILAGRKTMTRRVVKGHALEWLAPGMFSPEYVALPENDMCPYGRAGDRLWVREAIRFTGATPMGDLSEYEADGTLTKADGWPWQRNRLPSIHCPRGLSRLTLEITGVRVERVQDISEEDAEREGVVTGDPYERGDFRDCFRALWDSLNAERGHGWDVNPWVWVIEFRATAGAGEVG